MLVNRPEDRPKVIGLSITVALAMGYFGLFTLPRMMSHGHHETPETPAPAAPVTTVSEESLPPKSGVNLYTDLRAPAAGTPDPFTPPVVLPGTSLHAPPGKGYVKPGDPEPTGPSGPTPASAPDKQPAVVMPPPVPLIALQGVIFGEQAVGVFLIGDQTSYIHVGEKVAGGFFLAKITDTGAILKQGQEYRILEIGHSTLAPISKSEAKAAVSADAAPTSYAPPVYYLTGSQTYGDFVLASLSPFAESQVPEFSSSPADAADFISRCAIYPTAAAFPALESDPSDSAPIPATHKRRARGRAYSRYHRGSRR